MTDEKAYRALAAAVCLAAIDDYEKLCKSYAAGHFDCTPDGHPIWNRKNPAAVNAYNRLGTSSFFEIEDFFERYGELYAGVDVEPLLRMLRQKRRRAKKRADERVLRGW